MVSQIEQQRAATTLTTLGPTFQKLDARPVQTVDEYDHRPLAFSLVSPPVQMKVVLGYKLDGCHFQTQFRRVLRSGVRE